MASQPSPPNGSVASSTKPSAPAKLTPKTKPRKRVNTAEKRHQHNAIERARRETLNGKFIHLARLLPSLANSRRPSKSAIVNGSIAHLTLQREERLLAIQLLRKVCADHDALLNEVNDWRIHAGYPSKDAKPAWTEPMEALSSVEREVFGTFANYEGGDDDNDDDANDSNDQSSVQDQRPQTAATAVSLDTGLLTPRTRLDSMPNHNIFGNMTIPAPGLGGITWSHDFAADLTGQQRNVGPMSFPNFLNDGVDRASTDSPAASQVGGMVMTPNTAAEVNVFNTQTPSPRSTQSGSLQVVAEESKPAPPPAPPVPQGWAASQALFFQQQQQQLQRLHDQQHMAQAPAPVDPRFDRMLPGCGNNTFPMLPAPRSSGNNGSASNGQFTNQAFTQQLFASMFPNGNLPSSPHEQINQWRKNALGAMQPQAQGAGQMLSGAPSVDELRNAVRAGMGLGLGMANLWPEGQQNAVEGF